LSKIIHNWYREKSSLKVFATSVIFKTLSKVNNPPKSGRIFSQSGHPALQQQRLVDVMVQESKKVQLSPSTENKGD
jgi:hypothetical protein